MLRLLVFVPFLFAAQELSDRAKEAQKGLDELRALAKEAGEIQSELGLLKDQFTAAQQADDKDKMKELRAKFADRQARMQDIRAKVPPAAQTLEKQIDEGVKAAADDIALIGMRSQIRDLLGKRDDAKADAIAFLAKAKGPVALILQVAEVARHTEAFDAARKACAPLLKDHPAALATDALSAFGANDLEAAAKGLEAALKVKEKLDAAIALEVERAAPEAVIRLKESKAGDNPLVTLSTAKGDIEVELFENQAPNTVANFIQLAGERKFYNGLKFHRVIASFMVQGGDPAGNGSGGPGYRFGDEVGDGYRHHFRGSLSMANSGPNTNGSQFFITHIATTWLDGKHTVFGRVLKGLDVVDKIEANDVIKSMTVTRKRDHEYAVKKIGD